MLCHSSFGCRPRPQIFNIIELPVPLIYLDEKRSFGGVLDDGETRLKYYRQVVAESIARVSGDLVSRRTAHCGQGA